MCGTRRPNERFGGRGLRAIYCPECRRDPNFRRDLLLLELDGYLYAQSNISKKNRKRAADLLEHPDELVRSQADLVLQVGRCHPRSKRREAYLKRNRPELFRRLVGLNFDDEWRLEDFGGLCQLIDNETDGT